MPAIQPVHDDGRLVSYFPNDKVIPRVLPFHRTAFAVESVVSVEERVVGFAVQRECFHRLVEARVDVLGDWGLDGHSVTVSAQRHHCVGRHLALKKKKKIPTLNSWP